MKIEAEVVMLGDSTPVIYFTYKNFAKWGVHPKYRPKKGDKVTIILGDNNEKG